MQAYGPPRAPGNPAETASHVLAEVTNHSCGDSVSVSLHPAGQGFSVRVRGCSICRAAAALAEQLIQPTETGRAQCRAALTDLNGGQPPEEEPAGPDMLHDLALVRHLPARRRCATLPFEALEEALRLQVPQGVPEG